MILPAHLLGPSDQPRLDRDAEYASQRAYGVWASLLPVLLGVVSWGVVVLVGGWLVSRWRVGR